MNETMRVGGDAGGPPSMDELEPPITHPVLRECRDCGQFQEIAALAPGDAAYCRRCSATLRRGRSDTMNTALACSLAALVLFLIATQLPFLDLRSVGRQYQATLFTGPQQLQREGTWEIGAVVLVTLVAMPFIQLSLVLSVLIGVRLQHPPRVLPMLFGWVERVRPWSMIEVFLLGVFVAYTRLQAIAEVQVGPALLALGGVMLCMIAADAELDHEAVWEALEKRGLVHAEIPAGSHELIGCDCCRLVLRAPPGHRCPRCHRRLRRRMRHSLKRSWALLAAGAALYLPANIYPVMTVIRFGQGQPNTILGGVSELIEAQMWPLAALVFMASIVVPMLKLGAMFTLLIMTAQGSAVRLRDRTRIFRFVDGIGRWSMIDVFMITILVALVRLGFIATVLPGIGAVAFASVVILTMFAAASFDPRLMWDAAMAAGHDVEAESTGAPTVIHHAATPA